MINIATIILIGAALIKWHWWTILLVPVIIAIVIFSTIGIVKLLQHFNLINLPEKPNSNLDIDNDKKDYKGGN